MYVNCAPKDNFRYEQFKTIVSTDDISDLNFIYGYLNPTTSSQKFIDAYVCETYKSFVDLYGIYRDSISIDSTIFNSYKILSFGIITTNGDSLDSYSFSIKSDTLYLNCKIKIWDDGPIPDLAIPYIVTFKGKK